MQENKILIIAEAGVNHNGSFQKACQLIDKAAAAGADIIKFQSFVAKNLTTKQASKTEYQKKNSQVNESQYTMLKKLQIDKLFQKKLLKYCNKKKIEFLSSPFDVENVKFLKKIKLERFKIPSGEITNLPYLREIGKIKKKVIVSTGMSTLNEINDALKVLIGLGTKKNNITVLHCTTAYPTSMQEVNLSAMLTIKKKLNISVGYSDHTTGIEIPIAAAALGAKVIEKHITLSKKLKGPDHLTSLEPHEFKNMVNAIRNIEIAIGNGIKKPTRSELLNIRSVRKSIYAARNIKKDEKFTIKNLTTKRPAEGLSPMLWDKYINKVAKKNYKIDDLIE
jgi:N,N'-diacetyllegionaminate synthase